MLDIYKFKEKAYNLMEKQYNSAHSRLMKEFEGHKVTKEIEAGPLSANTSTLLNGYGNLFSFIGFSDDQEPIEDLTEYLEESMGFQQTVRRGTNWYFRIHVPSKKEVSKATPMPWEPGNSWVDGIEHGITNLSHYLYTYSDSSRSKEGVQLKHEYIGGAAFKTTPYLFKMLDDFREKFNK